MRAAAIPVGALLVLALGSEARAYPQYQLTTGAVRCNQCHFAPAGGGLISGWGREEAGDTISMGGDGAFLHGLWSPPRWLALGADFRVAAAAYAGGGENDPALFPMQADVYARVQTGAWSVYGSLGLRGSVRAEDQDAASWIASREHYVMWRPNNVGSYARAGKFFAPYGLRLVEHLTFVRRSLGFNLFEETYGLSVGRVTDVWELHLTAFTPDFFRPVGDRGSGGAAYLERRIGRSAALGAQARLSIAGEGTRLQGGGLAKWRVGETPLLLYTEVDVVRETFAAVDAPRLQLVGLAGASVLPLRGLLLDLFAERFDPDVSLAGDSRESLSLQLHWFPTAHVEAVILGRVQWLEAGSGGPTTGLAMLQLHYYL